MNLNPWMLKKSENDDKNGENTPDLVWCPHCNGYGSSFKDPENVNTCSICGGSGRVSAAFVERYKSLFEDDIRPKTGIRRYYLKRTSNFNNPLSEYRYDSGVFAKLILEAGGMNTALVKVESAGDRFSQNYVVAFDATEKTVPLIKKALDTLDVFKKYKCVIVELDTGGQL